MYGGLRNNVNPGFRLPKQTERDFWNLDEKTKESQASNNSNTYRWIKCQQLLKSKGIEPNWPRTCILYNFMYEDQVKGPKLEAPPEMLISVLSKKITWDDLDEMGYQ